MEKSLRSPEIKVINNESKILLFLKSDLPRYFLLIAAILIYVTFGLIDKNMFNLDNFFNIIATASITSIVAVGVMFAMVSGEMNFAAGAQATLAASILGKLMDSRNAMPIVLAMAIAIIVCMITGSGTSFLSQKVGVPSFIASLGIAKVIMGIVELVTENKVVFSKHWTKAYTFLGQYRITVSDKIKLPVIVLVVIIVGVLTWLVVEKTKLGRHIFAVGANKTTCRQVGINVKKIKWYAMLISSAVAAFGGIVATSRDYNVRPTLGGELMLDAIVAVMLGATFLRPGKVNVPGTILAAIMVTVIQNGIYTIGWSFSIRYLVQGVLFIIAVGVIAMTNREGLPSISFGK